MSCEFALTGRMADDSLDFFSVPHASIGEELRSGIVDEIDRLLQFA